MQADTVGLSILQAAPCPPSAQGDIVLVGLREYQDEKADVIMKYTADEARVLKQYGELPENIRINDTDVMFEGEDKENQEFFDFDDVDAI
jgi:translation initiation factor 1A